MAAKEEDDEGKKEEAAPKKSKKMLFIIVGVVVVLVLAGAAVFLLGGKKEEESKDKEKESHEEEPALHTFKLEPFIVNLAGGRQYLKVLTLIEYDSSLLPKKKHAEGEEAAEGGGHGAEEGADPHAPPPELEPRVPMMRDAVINLLTAKAPADVVTPEGKETLKEELVDVLNDACAMEDTPIVSVYFQEFIVQ
jgi:flagellar FliL protein